LLIHFVINYDFYVAAFVSIPHTSIF